MYSSGWAVLAYFSLSYPFISTQVLLSNKPKYSITAKYKLNASVRVHFGARDDAYHAIFQREDDEGHVGITPHPPLR
jgi:hypothetical protein